MLEDVPWMRPVLPRRVSPGVPLLLAALGWTNWVFTVHGPNDSAFERAAVACETAAPYSRCIRAEMFASALPMLAVALVPTVWLIGATIARLHRARGRHEIV